MRKGVPYGKANPAARFPDEPFPVLLPDGPHLVRLADEDVEPLYEIAENGSPVLHVAEAVDRMGKERSSGQVSLRGTSTRS